jgi:membrane-bound lytic murein transglycosylase D
LRSRFVLDGCHYSDAVIKEARTYTRAADIFTDSLRDAMPFLLLVVDELERRNLPGEFALLPYVESHYRPLPAKGRGAAGMWQLMGRTASAQGLQVSRNFDQRLDALESTRVALDLIERYDREFGDWRLATMAFNAGEYRVKRQLGNRSTTELGARELGQLKLSRITHQHLDRLLALACIVEQPEMFGIELPAPEEDDFLQHFTAASPIDMRLAANLLGMPFDAVHRLNAAWRADPEQIGPVASLLVPVNHVAELEEKLRYFSDTQLADWHEQRIAPGESLDSLAGNFNLSAQALAIANGLASDSSATRSSRMLLPGPGADAGRNPATHVVAPGDTLSAIALRYGVKIAQLMRWNNLDRNSILQLDMLLRIRAPQY